jgi:hypothetical protein
MFEHISEACDKPLPALPATVYNKRSRIVCTGYHTIILVEPTPLVSFKECLLLQNTISWCLYKLQVSQDIRLMIDAIKEGLAIAVSDGSYKDKFGTAAWTIGTAEQPGYISGRATCPGAEGDHSSYRSELSGIHSIMVVIQRLCTYFEVTEGQVELSCIGQSALQSAFEKGTAIVTDATDYDLVTAILSMRRVSTIR